MDPTVGAAFKASLSVAKQLPKLAQSGRVNADRRAAAYERFSTAVWSLVTCNSAVRSIQPVAAKVFRGLWFHPMLVRATERLSVAQSELLGAYGALRLVAPNAIVGAAEHALDSIAELVATPLGDAGQLNKHQRAVGLAMISFDLLGRIDLGVDRHPSEPRLRWYNPATWHKQLRWLLRSRRGDWPALPESATGAEGARRMAITS